MAEHDDAERLAAVPFEMAGRRGMGGVGNEPLPEKAQPAERGRQQDRAGRARHDGAGGSQANKGECRIAAQRNPVDGAPRERKHRAADERAGHVERAEPGMVEREFGPDRGAEEADIEGLPEARETGQQHSEPEERRVRGDEAEISVQGFDRQGNRFRICHAWTPPSCPSAPPSYPDLFRVSMRPSGGSDGGRYPEQVHCCPV